MSTMMPENVVSVGPYWPSESSGTSVPGANVIKLNVQLTRYGGTSTPVVVLTPPGEGEGLADGAPLADAEAEALGEVPGATVGDAVGELDAKAVGLPEGAAVEFGHGSGTNSGLFS